MNLLLKLLDRRVLAACALLLAALWAADRFRGVAAGAYERRRHPPQGAGSPLGRGIEEEAQARRSARLRSLHRTVSSEIAAARAQGFEVERLQAAADAALALDEPRYRDAAVERLQRLRLAVPRRREAFRPAADSDGAP